MRADTCACVAFEDNGGMNEFSVFPDGRHRCVPSSLVPRAAIAGFWPVVPVPAVGQVMAMANQLLANEWREPAQIQTRQLRQLHALIALAAQYSPFHAKRLQAAGLAADDLTSLADLRRLPLMTRADLQNGFDAIRSKALPKGTVFTDTLTTSGSSGVPVRVATTSLRGLMWLAVSIRGMLWSGQDPTDRLAAIRNIPKTKAPAAHRPEGIAMESWGGPMGQCFVTGPSFGMDIGMSLEAQVAFLQRVKPQCLMTFPSAVAELAEHLAQRQMTLPDLRLVHTLSEVVTEDLARRVWDVMGVRVFDTYSCKEVGNVASMCPGGHGYHVHDEGLVVEVLDEDGEPCEPGETGRVVVTDLMNFGFPIIRYEVGDRAVAGAAGPCPCGRGLSRLGGIVGRTWSQLVAMDGSRCCNSIVTREVREVRCVRQFRLVQRERGGIEVLVVPMDGFGAEHERQVIAGVQRRLGEAMAVTVTRVERIDRLPSGKFVDAVCTVVMSDE